jgi:dTDP-4-dehydrorhamnose reductase
LSVYGRSKLAGEEAVRAANPRHVILRTAWVYSPFGRNFVKTMVAAAQDRDVLTVVGDQHGSPTSALDLADAILEIVDGGRELPGKTYHLAGSGQASWSDLAAEVMSQCRRLGLTTAEVQPIRTEDWPTKATRPPFAVLDCGKIKRDLGIRLPDWRESVARAVERLG